MPRVGGVFPCTARTAMGTISSIPLILLYLIAKLNPILIGKEIINGGMNIARLAFSEVIAYRRYPGHPHPTRIEGFYHWTDPAAM